MRVLLSPNEILDRVGLRDILKIKDATISREVRLGRLRPSMVSGRQLFTGKAVIEWLERKATDPADDDASTDEMGDE